MFLKKSTSAVLNVEAEMGGVEGKLLGDDKDPDDVAFAIEEDIKEIPAQEACKLPVEQVLTTLCVDLKHGLDRGDVLNRQTSFGLNDILDFDEESIVKKYLSQFNNPFIILLLISAGVSIVLKEFDNAISITVAIFIVVTVGFVQEYRSEQTIQCLGSLLPPTCHCLRGGTPQIILADQLVPGDVVHFSIGDRVPADVRFVSVNELALDESNFTGETELKFKSTDSVRSEEAGKNVDVNNMTNVGFQGTLVVNGKGVGVVISTGERSVFGEIIKLMKSEEPPKTPLQESMEKLGKQLSVYSLLIILFISVGGYLRGKPLFEMFNIGVSLAVAAIPEGLPIVVTVTLAFGVIRMARKKAVVKRLPTVEGLGCVDWICSDKTGTLTSNQQRVANVISASEIHKNINGDSAGQTNLGDDVLEIGVMCNNATNTSSGGCDESAMNGSPLEIALLSYALSKGLVDTRTHYERLDEIPFSSERKFMSVEYQMGEEKVIFIKGAPEEVVSKCKYFALQEDEAAAKRPQLEADMTDDIKNKIFDAVHALNKQESKRVLAMAKGKDWNSIVFAGLAAFVDPPRPDVPGSIKTLKESGVRVCIVTGDNVDTAKAIAEVVGIAQDDHLVISGLELDNMSDQNLAEVVEDCYCFYRTVPRHKARIVKALQTNGHVVAMTGDGVNDSVAVKKADTGVAMGSGTDVCKEASDMILLDDSFSTILAAIEEGKTIFYNIRNFISFQLSTSVTALALISFSAFMNLPNPLNAMQILWINILMDGPPAQSLGLEAVDPDIVRRKPRRKDEGILSLRLMCNILLSAVIMVSGNLLIFFSTLDDNGQMTKRGNTMTFTCFVFFDLFNALGNRSQDRPILERGFFTNKVFWVAVVLSVLGQMAAIYFPPLQMVFQTEALSGKEILILTGLASSVFVLSEIRKYIIVLASKCKTN